MARYIDADALLKKAERVYNYGLAVSVDDIKDAPSVDVVEVKYGEWMPQETTFDCVSIAKCSACGEEYCISEVDYEDMRILYKYRPNCGAKMDGGK